MSPSVNFLEMDLQLAERVYRSLLPGRLTLPGVDVVTRVQPRGRIGGDYATVFPTGDGRVFVCVSDVTAHGISSALLVTRVNSFVRERVSTAQHPCELVRDLNAFLCENFSGLQMFLSFFCGTLDLRRQEFTYAGCGHPPALHFKASSPEDPSLLSSQHTLLGLFPELSQECQLDAIPVRAGDRILLYTDGLSEAKSPTGELWDVAGLAQAAGPGMRENLEGEAFADRVLAAAQEFQGGPGHDDVLLMVVSLL